MENREKFLEQKVEQIQKEQSRNIENTKRERKGLFTRIGAAIAAGAILITGIIHIIKRTKNNSKDNKPTYSTMDTTATITPEEEIDIDRLGVIYKDHAINTGNQQYGNTTGDVNKDEIVEKDGTNWKDQEVADKSDDVGKPSIDDNDGKYKQDDNGDVVDKEPGYEVKDDDGETKDEGTGIPEGYAWDDVLGKLVKKEDVGKYVYCDATYYDENGEVVFKKGDIVLKETLEEIKKNFTTKKPTKSENSQAKPDGTKQEETKPDETKPQETKPADEGTVNKNGTYTIYGVTYKSKADYQQFLLHPEQYGYYNGMVLSLEDIEELFNQSQKTK